MTLSRKAFRDAVREWISGRCPAAGGIGITDEQALIEERILTSLQIMDLLLFIEELTGRPVDVRRVRPGAFACIRAMQETFHPGADDDGA